MAHQPPDRLTDAELHALFDLLFPQGFAGADVLAELAPEGWEHSPLRACFQPSVEDALTELVGLCLWDVFSDNHDVVTADGRVADIGSFRGAGAFLDEHLARGHDLWPEGDYLRFYMGTIWIGEQADLTPVYAMVFRRLRALSADWVYHFPELRLTDLGPSDAGTEVSKRYSVSESAAAELEEHKRRADSKRLRADIEQINIRAREEAIDRPPPATVSAYRHVYGRDPRGWPPA